MAAELTYEGIINELKDVDKEIDERLFDLEKMYNRIKEMEKELKVMKETKTQLANYANNLRKVAEIRRIIEGIEEIPEEETALLKERYYYIVVDGNGKEL